MAVIPFLIGKTSDNKLVRHDLLSMQHLFISYAEQEQFDRFIKDVVTDLGRGREDLFFAPAVTRNCYQQLLPYMFNGPVAKFIHKDGEQTNSKLEFMRGLVSVLKFRQKQALNGQPIPGRIIILIEDVFSMVIPDKKGMGNLFLQLLLQGPSLGMHMVIGSIRTYRNLLTQLIHLDLHPKLRKQFGDVFNKSEALGAELVLNTEELVFYKSREEYDYRRYYGLREVETMLHDS